jgi:hypothetical protein
VSFVVRVWLTFQILGQHLPAPRRVNDVDQVCERRGAGAAAERENTLTIQQQFHAPTQFGPEFHLAGNGTFLNFPGKTGIEHKGIRKLDGLTQGVRLL